MDTSIKQRVDQLSSSNDAVRLKALQDLLKKSEARVPWVYDVWDTLLERLDDPNSYQRSIAILLLCNLAKSDTKGRLSQSLGRLLQHTHDPSFITSRQCLQNVWKLAATDPRTRKKVLNHLESRFLECEDEKHYNLLRQDIIQSISELEASQHDPAILRLAWKLIAQVPQAKYRKRYQAILPAQ
jgi:hypothetical protein